MKKRDFKQIALLYAADRCQSRYELLQATSEFNSRRRDVERLLTNGFLRPCGKRPGKRGGEVQQITISDSGREWLQTRFHLWKARAEYYEELLRLFGFKSA